MRRRGALMLAGLLATPAAAAEFGAIEREAGGRLGVAACEAVTGRALLHRAGERFPMASTFKTLLAAAVLARGDGLPERLAVPATGLVPWSPVTQTRAGEAMTPAELCEATLVTSDNTAANLLLDAIGGPPALTAWLRGLGDAATRLDRREPTLNEASPGDPRDTTTPAAMLATLERILLGDALAAAGRARLLGWMEAHRFGGALLRAGMPGWTLADRTGAGGFGSRGVVALARPPGGGAPWLIAAYLHEGPAALAARDAVLARVGAAVAAAA